MSKKARLIRSCAEALLGMLAVVAIVELVQRQTPIPLPNPIHLLLLFMVILAMLRGLLAGLVASGVVLGYALYHLAEPGQAFVYSRASTYQLIQNFVVIPAIALIVGMLRWRLDQMSRREESDRIGQERLLLLERMTDAHIALDRNWRYVEANDRACQIIGVPREELLGLNIWELFNLGPGDAFYDTYNHTMKTREPMHMEGYYERWGKWYESHIYPSERGVIVFFQDVTERKRMEEDRAELLRREKTARAAAEAANRAKDQFLGVVSHELRTPLTPVLLYASALERSPDVPPRLREDIGIIRAQVEIEARLIDDLLDLTRVTGGRLSVRRERCDAHAVLRDVVELYREALSEKKLTLNVRTEAPRPVLLADPARLRQVFWNLLGNAIKFTPEGRTIDIQTDNPSDNDMENGAFRFMIRDEGIGMEPQVLARIFNPFEQAEQSLVRRFGGLGLGLSIARGIVELHGGRITAQSDGIDQGSTFTVLLPIGTPPQAQPKPDDSAMPATQRAKLPTISLTPAPGSTSPSAAGDTKPRILLVEDNIDTRDTFERHLRQSGHEVATASGVAEAMQRAEVFKPDLLISDLGLTDGTGWELMRQLRERGPMPGIAISGFGEEADIARSIECGFFEQIVKPVSLGHLDALIRRAMSQKPDAAGHPSHTD